MADNIYELLQSAWQVARVGGAKIFGVEIGVVTNLRDPDKLGRVKLCFPRLPGKPESSWARVARPSAGPGRGFYWLPEVEDEVLVAFERGEANRPYVIGALWNGVDRPMPDAYADDNTTRMIQSKSGHQIVFSDKDGEEKIVISDKSGKRVLTFDVKAKKFLVEASEGDLELHAEKKIVLQCADIEIKTGKTAKLDIGSTFDLTVADKAQIKAANRLDVKAQRVNINPGGGAGAGGSGAKAGAGGSSSGAAEATAGAGTQGSAGGPGGGDLSADQGTPASAKAAGEAAAAAVADAAEADRQVAPDELEVQLVNAAGTPQKNVEVELTLASGDKRAGKTGADGRFKLDRLATQKGDATLDVPDVQVAKPAPASAAGRVRFVEGGVGVPIGKSTVVELPPRVRRARMKGMHFDTGKTFLLPSAMVGIRQLVKLFKSFEGIVGLVTGHTDRQGRGGVDASKDPGAVENNRVLSNDRADILRAFLLDDADAWMPAYKDTRFRPWGVLEDQHMLGTVKPKGSDTPFLSPPNADGKLGPDTSAAYKDFQRSRLLTETGKPDKETRLELVRAYMALEGTSLQGKAPVETHGCGLTHPTPETEGDPSLTPEERAKATPDQPVNRRVEIFLFEEKIDPAPLKPCPSAGCTEYARWVAQKILDVDLDQPPGVLDVKVTAEDGSPIAGADVHASGPLILDALTGADGAPATEADGSAADFTDLVPGSYKVVAEKDGLLAADATVDVPSGGKGSAVLVLKQDVSLANPRATPKPAATDAVTVRLLGIARKPCPNCEATVTAGKVRIFGKSDANGVLQVAVPQGTTQIDVTYAATDAQGLVSCRIRLGLGAVDTEDGAVGRLLNLGYPADTNRAFAIFSFQADNGLPATVQLDAATRKKLAEVHGG